MVLGPLRFKLSVATMHELHWIVKPSIWGLLYELQLHRIVENVKFHVLIDHLHPAERQRNPLSGQQGK